MSRGKKEEGHQNSVAITVILITLPIFGNLFRRSRVNTVQHAPTVFVVVDVACRSDLRRFF